MTTQNRVITMGAGLSKSDLETFANWDFVEATDVPEQVDPLLHRPRRSSPPHWAQTGCIISSSRYTYLGPWLYLR